MKGTFSIVLSLLVRCEAIGVFHRWLVGDFPLIATSQTMNGVVTIYGKRGNLREIVSD